MYGKVGDRVSTLTLGNVTLGRNSKVEALSSRRKNQEVWSLCGAIAEGPPSTFTSREKRAVINASTVTRRSFRSASGKMLRVVVSLRKIFQRRKEVYHSERRISNDENMYRFIRLLDP